MKAKLREVAGVNRTPVDAFNGNAMPLTCVHSYDKIQHRSSGLVAEPIKRMGCVGVNTNTPPTGGYVAVMVTRGNGDSFGAVVTVTCVDD